MTKKPSTSDIAWANQAIGAMEAFKQGLPIQMRRRYDYQWHDFDLSAQLEGDGMIQWRPRPILVRARKPRSHPKMPVVIPFSVGEAALKEIFGDESVEHFQNLDDRERAIMVLRFGKQKTLKVTGKTLGGLSVERTRQLQNVALSKIRRSIRLNEPVERELPLERRNGQYAYAVS